MTSHGKLYIFPLFVFILNVKGFLFGNKGSLSKSQIIDCLEDITGGKLKPECNVHVMKSRFSDDNNEFRKVMIKRLVPHNSPIQTIQIHNGIYKPLKRIPKIHEPIDFKAKIPNAIIFRQIAEPNAKSETKNSIFRNVKHDIKKLLKSKLIYSKKERELMKHKKNIQDIKNLLFKGKKRDSNNIQGNRNPLVAYIDAEDLLKYVRDEKKEKTFKENTRKGDLSKNDMDLIQFALRGRTAHKLNSNNAKSSEDPLEDLPTDLYDEITHSPPVKWIPNYSYWNYWTYDKTIHQDRCKGPTVEVNGVCISYPPH